MELEIWSSASSSIFFSSFLDWNLKVLEICLVRLNNVFYFLFFQKKMCVL